MIKKLKEEKNGIIQDILYSVLGILLFPVTGLCLFCFWLVCGIIELIKINKKIKIEKMKEIVKEIAITLKNEI